MKKFVKRGLVAVLALLLVWPGSLSVRAEEAAAMNLSTAEAVGDAENSSLISEETNKDEIREQENTEDVDNQIMLLADDDIASGVDGDITWVIDADGKLTVNGSGDLSGSQYFRPWYEYSEQIISAEVNVMGMTNASSLFSDCGNLTSVDVSGLDTENVTNMSYMFSGCSSLTSVDVSGLDTGNVTNMHSMFSGCSNLTSLNVSGFDTSNVTDMWYMFSGCSSLMSLDLNGLDTGNVTSMAFMFSGCSNLTSLDLNGLDTGNVTYMSSMFSGCSNLTSLDLSGLDTGNATYMWGMFSDCSNLTSLDLSGFDTGNVTDMSDMFSGCSSLESIETPRNVAVTALLPVVSDTVWYLPDGTEVTELPQGLDYSVTLTRSDTPITTTTADLNMEDVIRVKYVPYSYTVETSNTDPDNIVTFSIEEGSLAEGLELHPTTGEIYGVPLEAGDFTIKVKASYSNPLYPPAYAELTVTVLDNTDGNVGVATDSGYEITQPVLGFDMDNIAGSDTQTVVSQGEYSEFRDVYIDGRKLAKGQDYTSEAGSTRITILNQTLSNGGEGMHTLGIEFRTEDGTLKRAAQNYTINKSAGGDKPGGNTGNNLDDSASDDSDDSSDNTAMPASVPSAAEYLVVKGDNLSRIAARNGLSLSALIRMNPQIKNPNLIYPGQIIYLGQRILQQALGNGTATAPVEGSYYVVQKGDSLYRIAAKHNVPFATLLKLNQKIAAQKYIFAGQKVLVK